MFDNSFSQAKNSCSNSGLFIFRYASISLGGHRRVYFYKIKLVYPIIVNNFCIKKNFSQAKNSCSYQVISYSHASTASGNHCREFLCNIKVVYLIWGYNFLFIKIFVRPKIHAVIRSFHIHMHLKPQWLTFEHFFKI